MITGSIGIHAPGQRRSRKAQAVDPASAPAYLVLGLLACIVGAAVVSRRFTVDERWASDAGEAEVLLVAFGWLTRRSGFPRVAGFVEALAVFLGLAILAPLCAVVMASTNLPLADDALRAADAHLFGFDRAAVSSWLEPKSTASRTWIWIYNSLTFQPLALLGALILSGRRHLAWTLLAAWGAALLLSVAIFPLLPAYGTPPYVLAFVDVLKGARDGSLRELGVGALTGIITFPSFHAAAATMLAWGFLAFGRLA